jgi:ABC-type branched-subunit amino acid transport system ATPase component
VLLTPLTVCVSVPSESGFGHDRTFRSPDFADQAVVNRRIDEVYSLLPRLAERRSRQGVAHRAYVVENGVITLSGTAAELARDSRVVEAYLGA